MKRKNATLLDGSLVCVSAFTCSPFCLTASTSWGGSVKVFFLFHRRTKNLQARRFRVMSLIWKQYKVLGSARENQ